MVDNNSVSLSGVQGASKASSSLSRGETETTGTGNNCHSDQGETAATAVVIEDEDWGLYIRAEEDYQRTKQVWTKEHKEWIEDQVSVYYGVVAVLCCGVFEKCHDHFSTRIVLWWRLRSSGFEHRFTISC